MSSHLILLDLIARKLLGEECISLRYYFSQDNKVSGLLGADFFYLFKSCLFNIPYFISHLTHFCPKNDLHSTR